jgi:predicted RNA-binding Zn ribbon-like protein
MARTAPAEIETVQSFVNTANLEDERDELSTPSNLARWFEDAGLVSKRLKLNEADRERAVTLREALRDLIGVNDGTALSPASQQVLDEAAADSDLRVRFLKDGSTAVEPSAGGLDGALGRILAAAHVAMSTGAWAHFKLCQRDRCRWAFYDVSKNQSRRWCSMESCGNREKGEAFRNRRRATPR